MGRTAGLSPFNVNAVPLVQRSIAAAGISTSYAIVGSQFAAPVVWLGIVSTLDQTVQISFNGVDDWLPIVAGGLLVIDLKSDNIVLSGIKAVYVKEIGNPTSGSLYVGGFST